ncbi:piggyBac transposable element-derived protein 5-like [Sinocyclocheilus anshuiensis]|uniref:piggyBac transposable element-derived protein 5-like n=1 Tax=Sinocyclocheilus anshuiensis TaxID=1608454 RepID=UPI0007BA6F9B|nr:PREDICTED: piggyBac transposable element-derived protein 5-like [Sinocyclocheilus anshuiensis]
MAECGRRGLSLLEEARSRYESLQISDDVFGESGDDSSENPFYSTTGDSNSDNYTETNPDDARAGETRGQSCGPPGSASNGQAQEEGWSDSLQDLSVPHYQDTHVDGQCSALGFSSLQNNTHITLQQSFASSFRPSQTQVLHEPLIDEDPVFITTCTERELRKRKKRKFSLWVRQCSSTGFICQIYVHLKEGPGPDGLDTLKNKPQLHSLVAKQLCQNLAGRNAIIFTGPSITSLNLFQEFEKQGIYCCGLLSTRKSDCTGLPQSMLINTEAPQQRGQSHIKMRGNMSIINWYNKGNFRFLTNAYPPTKEGVIIKRKSGEIPCPLAVEAFAAHLSYICKYDDKYSKYFIFHKPNKTWQQVFWLTISIAINNAYILYKMSDTYHVKRYSRAQFGERLVKELLDMDDCSPTQ